MYGTHSHDLVITLITILHHFILAHKWNLHDTCLRRSTITLQLNWSRCGIDPMHWELKRYIVLISIWRMGDMKATLRCNDHASTSVHRGTAVTSIILRTHYASTKLILGWRIVSSRLSGPATDKQEWSYWISYYMWRHSLGLHTALKIKYPTLSSLALVSRSQYSS